MSSGRVLLGSLAVVTPIAALAGCAQSAPNAPYTPITGIEVPASDIAAGHGCGTGQGQVFKYIALVEHAAADVASADTSAIASNVFDCFADGMFSNLSPSDSGSQDFVVSVYAFSRCSFLSFMDGGLDCLPGAATHCPAQDPSVVALAIGAADWTTTCTATQVQGVTVVAACARLGGNDAGAGCPTDGGVQ